MTRKEHAKFKFWYDNLSHRNRCDISGWCCVYPEYKPESLSDYLREGFTFFSIERLRLEGFNLVFYSTHQRKKVTLPWKNIKKINISGYYPDFIIFKNKNTKNSL